MVMALCLRREGEVFASQHDGRTLLKLDGCRQEPIHLLARSVWKAGPGVRIHRTAALPACDITRVGAIRGRPGTAALSRLLGLRDPAARPAQSVLEVRFLQRLRHAKVSSPVRQFQAKTSKGMRYLDFAWPQSMLAVEVGGGAAHAGPAAQQKDSQRHNELTHLGWRILYFTWADVEHRMDYVVECIQTELAARR